MNKLKLEPIFSVVTVTYNAAASIEITLQSIFNQSRELYEFIVIDGGSKDATLDILDNIKSDIDVLISEPDKGIYDAMNKGVLNAKGKYIIFMNSGDRFASSDTLKNINGYLSVMDVDLLAGSVEVLYPDNKIKVKAALHPNLKSKFMPISHQSLFAKRDVLLLYQFDLKYKLAADFNFLMHSIRNGCSFYLIPDVVSKVSSGGVSDIKRCTVWNEYQSIYNTFNKKTLISTLYFLNKKVLEIIKKTVKVIVY